MASGYTQNCRVFLVFFLLTEREKNIFGLPASQHLFCKQFFFSISFCYQAYDWLISTGDGPWFHCGQAIGDWRVVTFFYIWIREDSFLVLVGVFVSLKARRTKKSQNDSCNHTMKPAPPFFMCTMCKKKKAVSHRVKSSILIFWILLPGWEQIMDAVTKHSSVNETATMFSSGQL